MVTLQKNYIKFPNEGDKTDQYFFVKTDHGCKEFEICQQKQEEPENDDEKNGTDSPVNTSYSESEKSDCLTIMPLLTCLKDCSVDLLSETNFDSSGFLNRFFTYSEPKDTKSKLPSSQKESQTDLKKTPQKKNDLLKRIIIPSFHNTNEENEKNLEKNDEFTTFRKENQNYKPFFPMGAEEKENEKNFLHMPKNMTLSLAQLEHVFSQVREHLTTLFENGIFYIDVKADNIFIARNVSLQAENKDVSPAEKNDDLPVVFIGDIESIVFEGDKENCLPYTYFYPGALQSSSDVSESSSDESDDSSLTSSEDDEECDKKSSIYAKNVQANKTKWIQFCTSALVIDFLFTVKMTKDRKKEIIFKLHQCLPEKCSKSQITDFKDHIEKELRSSAKSILEVLLPKKISGDSLALYKRAHKMVTRSMMK